MDNPIVSIIVPAYNAEKSIAKCMQSLCDQTYKRIEIIVIDDGSVDKTKLICMAVQQHDDRVKYVYQQNQGPSVARNKGIEMASGEYIMFVDADDQLVGSAVQTLVVEAIEIHPDLISFDFEVVNDTGEIGCKETAVRGQYPSISMSTGLECLLNIYSGNGIGNFSWAFFYNSSFLQNSGVHFDPNIHLLEDALFLNLLLRRSTSVHYCNKKLYHYVIGNTGSLTQASDSDHVVEGMNSVLKIAKLAQQDGIFQKFRQHGIDLLFFLDSRTGSSTRSSRIVHFWIRSKILSWYRLGGKETLSMKSLAKIFLIQVNAFDLFADVSRKISIGNSVWFRKSRS